SVEPPLCADGDRDQEPDPRRDHPRRPPRRRRDVRRGLAECPGGTVAGHGGPARPDPRRVYPCDPPPPTACGPEGDALLDRRNPCQCGTPGRVPGPPADPQEPGGL